jgi:hypothetical protein
MILNLCFACLQHLFATNLHILARTLILYSYLMGVDAIDQSICPEVLGMTNCSIA